MLVALLLSLSPAATDDRPEIVLADFESPTYGSWVATGEAFGAGPARGALPGQMAVGDYRGDGLVNSFAGGDDSEGTLTSPAFSIERKYLRFLIGGGRHPGAACMNLAIDGRVVRTATGHDSEFLRASSWDVTEFAGREARIEIVDRRQGQWGHVSVDQIVLTDEPPAPSNERETLLAKAEASVAAAVARAEADPLRPIFHVTPPAFWSNDPNGPIYYKGYYHLFLQHNPYGDDWGNMHWAHVRSKDLAHWERMPIALWPSKEAGEDHVFSGSATVNPRGQLMLFYTSIGRRAPEQWAALPEDPELKLWKKHPANPILTEATHGPTKVYEWRDPFVFASGGKTYMVLGGNLNDNRGGQGVVTVYRAEDDDLTRWTYLGVLFQHPDREVKNVECPLFFPMGDRWALMTSQGRPVHWFVGTLDSASMKFTAERRGIVDAGNFYAPNVTTGPDGRTLLWGWVPDFPKGRGWNGCLTLPRVVTLTDRGDLAFAPAPQLKALVGSSWSSTIRDFAMGGNARATLTLPGGRAEIRAEIDPGAAGVCTLEVMASDDGRRSVPITFDGETLDVAGARVAVAPRPNKALGLTVFLDGAVVEVYTNTGDAITRVVAPGPGDTGVKVHATGEKAMLRSLDARPMGSIWESQ